MLINPARDIQLTFQDFHRYLRNFQVYKNSEKISHKIVLSLLHSRHQQHQWNENHSYQRHKITFTLRISSFKDFALLKKRGWTNKNIDFPQFINSKDLFILDDNDM